MKLSLAWYIARIADDASNAFVSECGGDGEIFTEPCDGFMSQSGKDVEVSYSVAAVYRLYAG